MHALEVAQYRRTGGIHWVSYRGDGTVPLPDGSVDVVTCLMALHHMERPEGVLREIGRLARAGATIIVRETDAFAPEHALFSDVMDRMFYSVFSSQPDVPTPAQYRSAAEWKALFEREGFAVTVVPADEPTNPYRPVYFVLAKRPLPQSRPSRLPILEYSLGR